MMLEGATHDTKVVVMDPAPLAEEPWVLNPRVGAAALSEPMLRLEVARALGNAGAFRTAGVIAQRDLALSTPALAGPAQRDRARAALAAGESYLDSFESFGETWIGERVVVPLYEPLQMAGRVYRYARLTEAVSHVLVGELRESATGTPLFQEQYPDASASLRTRKIITGDEHATIICPGLSLSSVELLERVRGRR